MDWSELQPLLANANIQPRTYQARIIEKTVNMFIGEHRNGAGETEELARSVMIESPTGSGKTTMALMIAKVMSELLGVRIGWVAMRENLRQQAMDEAKRHNIAIENVQYISMFDKNPPTNIDLLVVDECQHDASSSATHIHNTIKPSWILGLTATPFRSDRVRLCFDKIVKDTGIHQLISDGYLSRFDHYTIPKWEVESLVDLYCSDRDRWGKSIFFFHRTSDCFRFNQLVQQRGVRSDVVTGDSDRDAQLTAFRRGELEVLSNCMVLTEGFDDPSIKTAWVRPSCRGATIQMAGRALRLDRNLQVKQIVQCRQTPHPFLKTAKPNQQFLLHADGWRSLTANPKIDLCTQNACRAIAQTVVALPKFLSKKLPKSKQSDIESRRSL